MPELTAEPLSPELILVSPPEEAALAREQLPDPSETLRPEVRREAPKEVPSEVPVPADPSDATWNDFLADVRSRPVDPVVAARPRPRPRPPTQITRNRRRWLLIATAAIVAVGAVVGLGWARDRSHQKSGSSVAPKPAKHTSATPAPAVTTAPKAKSSKPRSSHGGGFVPTRVWSWAAAPGASTYVVRFLRDGHKVLKIRTGAPRLQLPSRFSFTPGRYRWTVTTVPRKGKLGHVIVNSAFTVGASNG